MYSKILKESASELSLLVVESDVTSRNMIEKNLVRFFKSISYVSTADEALRLYKSEKFDLILVDIDMFDGDAYRFIDNVHRHDMFQAMAVCSSRIDDAELMLKLLNSQIACFIPKPSEADTMHKILSKVCGKIHDRAVLMHYVEMLENQQEKSISLSYKTESLINVEPKSTQPEATVLPLEEEDDFMFFPDTAAITTSTVDVSIYQDYYRFLDADDREELIDLINDIDSALLNAFNGGGDEVEISRLGSSLMRYGNVLLHYQFFSDMGSALLEFGKSISDHANLIAIGSQDVQMLISGFCSGLQTFLNDVWEKECDNPKFFNDSIINDAQTIMSMIVPVQSSGGSDDDLFFF